MLAALHAELVELDTDIGSIYLRPVGWERLYMLWIFRHFHTLPQQVLSAAQRAVVESLCRSAVANPADEVDPSTIIGRVENITMMGALAQALAEVKPLPAPIEHAYQGAAPAEYACLTGSAAPVQPSVSAPAKRRVQRPGELNPKALDPICTPHALRNRLSLRERLAMPAALMIAALVIAAVAIREPQTVVRKVPHTAVATPQPSLRAAVSEPAHVSLPPSALRPDLQAAVASSAWSLPYVPLPTDQSATGATSWLRRTSAAEKVSAPRLSATNALPVTAPAANSISPGSQLPEFFGAPQDALVRPEYPAGAISGTVVLRAVVAATGRVATVETVRGKPVLARAAARAVKAWRYRPYQPNGRPVQFQTRAVFRFAGGEIISIIFPGS
jgi:TonB family protein